uniref:cysteine dioxygenase n=1 Tax=Oryza sativa subsp. japonica TaxID=39947 RepID=Q7XWY0_ORYSJ|nr:OSJNBa0036B17.10 [Oryza sativa Japonica Group]
MDSRRLSFPVDRPRVHSAGLSSPPPLLITTTTSPPACLRRRRLVPPPTRLAYYAAAVGRLRLHRRPASVAADWCLRLHGWPIMPPLLGVYDFTAGLPPSPPTGVLAYTVGWSHHRSWASMPPPTRLAYYAAAVGRLRLHRRPASVAAEWCLRLHGWPIMPPLLGVYDFTAGLPPSPPTGVLAYTAGLLCRRCWASTTSPPACLRRRRLVSSPTRLAYYAAAVGRLRLHRRPASVAADWCLRLHGWPIMPPLLGVYDFTAGPPPSPPSGASAYTAGLLCRRCWASNCWASTTSPPACLRRRRLVPPPTRLAYYAAAVGRLRLHRRPASVAADWCLRLHGWPIMPPLLGVYDFTAGLPPSPPTGASAYTAGLLCRRCWASTTSPPARLRRRRVVPPPTRLAYYAAAVGRLRLHRRPASVAAEWCLRLHGWPIMPPLLGVYDFTAGLPPSPPTSVLAYTAGLLCRRCWASTTSPPDCLHRRRVVPPPTRLAYYAAAVGRLRLHRRPASVAADWCPRLHGCPIMPPLLGVYDFTAGLPPSPPSGASAYTAGLLCRRCWASTTSPPACLRRRRLVPPPTRLAYYAAAVGRLRLHRRPASVAADWCLRLHGWPIMPPLLGVYDFTAGLPPSPPIGASAYTAGLLCRRCWASTTSPPACLRRRRLVPPPTRLAYYAAAVGRLRLHRRLASVAAEWCLRLHGWPIMPPLLDVYILTVGSPSLPSTGVSAYTAGLLCRRCWMSTSSPLAHLRCRRLVFPLTRLTYYAAISGHLRFHRRPPSSPPTGVFIVIDGRLCSHIGHFRHHQGEYYKAKIQIQICIKGIHGFKLISYAPGMDQSEHHHRLASTAADWCFCLHGWPIMPPLLGVYVFTDRPAFAAAGWCFRLHGWPLCRRCWASTSSSTGRLDRRRLVFPPARLAYYAAVVGRLRLHRPAASSAVDWCFRLHGWPIMPPLLGVYVFTDRPPRPPLPTGVSACTAGLYAAVVGRLRLHRPACLRRCRLVFPPARLAFMPPLLGVYVFTDRPPRPPPTGASACTAGLYAAVVGRLRLHRPACLRRRRLVFPPARLAFMPPLLGVYVFTDRLAFAAADWCFRLHGWPIMPPLLGVYVFTDRLAFAAADWCFRLHGWPIMPPLLGVYVFTDRLAFAAADWCFRLHGWPIMPPLLGVYVFTDRLAFAAADWCFRLHGWPIMPPLLGVYVFTDRLAFAAADWCFRLHGWPIMPPLLGVYVFTDRPPCPPLTGVSACTAGLLYRRCWASTSSPTGRLVRRRLVSPPARLACYDAN